MTDFPLVSWLRDGRLFFMSSDGKEHLLVTADGGVSWEAPEGIQLSTVIESKPLPDFEILNLMARGMLPRMSEPKSSPPKKLDRRSIEARRELWDRMAEIAKRLAHKKSSEQLPESEQQKHQSKPSWHPKRLYGREFFKAYLEELDKLGLNARADTALRIIGIDPSTLSQSQEDWFMSATRELLQSHDLQWFKENRAQLYEEFQELKNEL